MVHSCARARAVAESVCNSNGFAKLPKKVRALALEEQVATNSNGFAKLPFPPHVEDFRKLPTEVQLITTKPTQKSARRVAAACPNDTGANHEARKADNDH